MNANLFHSIMRDAKENDETVTIVFDTLTSCGGYSSKSTSITVKAREVFELDEHIQIRIKDNAILSVQDISGIVFAEYNLIKMVIVKD